MNLSIIGIACFFIVLKMIEFITPLRKTTQSWQKRAMINVIMGAMVFTTAAFTINPTSRYLVQWTQDTHIGLLYWLHLPTKLNMIIGFLLMDVSFYYWHRLNHYWPLLWRFHNVHHIDPDLDVTTSFRFHIVEIAYSVFFRLAQLTIVGINPMVFLIYGFVFQVNTLFQHSNIKLPIRFERIINKILVTPRMHGIHHSQYKHETNSNYAVVFSVWDRLHNTLNLNVPQSAIDIGIPAYQHKKDNQLPSLLIVPFKKQHEYWNNGKTLKIERNESKSPNDLLEE